MKAFIITRDRVEYAKRTAAAFDAAGLDVLIVDHGSTYEPMLEWLKGRSQVHYRGPGNHPRSVLDAFPEICRNERFVLSDPDTPPSEGCPADWLEYLNGAMDNTGYHRIGLGLRIDNIPDHYVRRHQVESWERQYWQTKAAPGIWLAGVDTTIALHAPTNATARSYACNGFRTDFPYVADHLPWYEDYGNLAPDVAYYHEHAERGISEWTLPGKSLKWKD